MFIREDEPHGKTTHYTITETNTDSFATPGHDIRFVARSTTGKKIYVFISREELAKIRLEAP